MIEKVVHVLEDHFIKNVGLRENIYVNDYLQQPIYNIMINGSLCPV